MISKLNAEKVKLIYSECNTPDNVIAHCKTVADFAFKIAQRHGLDSELVYYAGLLHDILRAERNHAYRAADFLRSKGYEDVAALVALHHSPSQNLAHLDEAGILFYADKRCFEAEIVSIDERFAESLKKCSSKQALKKHAAMYETSKTLEKLIDDATL